MDNSKGFIKHSNLLTFNQAAYQLTPLEQKIVFWLVKQINPKNQKQFEQKYLK